MKVLYFSWVREKTGVSSEEIVLPEGVDTAAQLVAWLKDRGGGFSDAFEDIATVRVAINQEHVDLSYPVKDLDEVAFFPPITGGWSSKECKR